MSFGNYQQFLLLSSFRTGIINCTQVACNHLCCHQVIWKLPTILLLSHFRMEIINCNQVVWNHLCCHLAMWQLPKIIIAVIFLSFGKYWKLLFLSSRHFEIMNNCWNWCPSHFYSIKHRKNCECCPGPYLSTSVY